MTIDQFIALPIASYLIPAYFFMMAVEWFGSKVFKRSINAEGKDSFLCIFMGLSSAVANGLAAFITLGALLWAAQYQVFDIPNTALVFVLCFVLDDLRFYVHHRIAHRCRWVWAMHVVHHSSTHYCLPVALRQAWTKHFTGTMFLKIPLIMIGFDPLLVITCGVLNAGYQFLLHTETVGKLPRWFEAVFNTPSHHRVHHARNPQYLDANYAGTLIVWDRLFGSFVEEESSDRPQYGLVKNISTYNPIKIAFAEYWNIAKDLVGSDRTVMDRLAYLFGPPGWSHDGSRQTTQDIKRQYRATTAVGDMGLTPAHTP